MEKFVYEKHTFQDVKDKFENYIHNSDDIKRIEFAFEYASEKHSGQVRKSGEPYIIHIIEVAYILACLNAGPNTLIAGILHDVQEDCNVTNEEISKTFSPEIATLVDALTKIQALSRRKDKEFLGVITFYRTIGKDNFQYDDIFLLDLLKDHLAYRLYRDRQECNNGQEKLTVTEAAEKYGLTKREHTILRLLMQGKDNNQLCEELSISVNTLKKHILNIYRKLGIRNRVQMFKMVKERE